MRNRTVSSKSGGTFLGVIVSLFILLGMATMLVTTSRYFAQNQKDIRTLTLLEQTITNEVANLYMQEGWSTLTDKKSETAVGDVAIHYDYEGVSDPFRTHVLVVTFHLGAHTETYRLERSVTADEGA